jgi:2-polyprenyl-3-methyl-5-hydroxy-6-metoxy-1,4-benzoquinol methylase
MTKEFPHDFEEMEENMKKLLSVKVKEIMRTKIDDGLVYPNSSIIHVLSVMNNLGFSHLAVINQKKEIVGMIHQRDIFRALVGSETPFTTSFDYHDWTARFYDMVYTSSDRYAKEVDSLITLFKKKGVKNVLDIGFGTGTHATLLAKAGFNVVAIERSKVPHGIAQQKRANMSESMQKRLQFVHNENIVNFLEKSDGAYDAIMIMGNILSHYTDWKEILDACVKTVGSPGLIITESVNSKKILQRKDGFLSSSTAASKLTDSREYSFTLFYDRPWNDQDYILFNMSVLRFDGTRWTKEAINSAKVRDFKEHDLTSALKKAKIKKIDVFGSQYGQKLFEEKFDISVHDWFIHVATT